MSFNKTPLEPGYKTKMCQNSMSPWCKENKQKNNKILSVEFNYTFSWGFWKCKLKSLKKMPSVLFHFQSRIADHLEKRVLIVIKFAFAIIITFIYWVF